MCSKNVSLASCCWCGYHHLLHRWLFVFSAIFTIMCSEIFEWPRWKRVQTIDCTIVKKKTCVHARHWRLDYSTIIINQTKSKRNEKKREREKTKQFRIIILTLFVALIAQYAEGINKLLRGSVHFSMRSSQNIAIAPHTAAPYTHIGMNVKVKSIVLSLVNK